MNLHDQYRFFAVFQGGFTIQVFPANDSLLFTDIKDPGKCYFRTAMETELCFVNDPSRNINDFSLFYDLDQSPSRCTEIIINIEQRCSGSWQQLWSGFVCFDSFNFDCDLCTATVQLEPNDEYRCYEMNKGKEFNIFDCPTVTIRPNIGTFETFVCSCDDTDLDPLNNCPIPASPAVFDCGLPGAPGSWAVLSHYYNFNQFFPLLPQKKQTTWIREVTNAASIPPGAGWVEESPGFWVRPAITCCFETDINGPFFPGYKYQVSFTDVQEIDNGVRFSDILQKCADVCDVQIVSNFFGINPDGTAPTNKAYLCAGQYLRDLVVFDKFDIETPQAIENSTQGLITCKKIFEEILPIMYDVCFDFEGGVLRIEHESYFKAQEGQSIEIDLTANEYKKCMLGKNKYSYDKAKKARSEKWNYAEQVSFPFIDSGVNYSDNKCFEDANDEEYLLSCVNNDIEKIYGGESDPEDDIFAFVSTFQYNGIPHILITDVLKDGEPHHNGHHAWSNLFDCYHTFCRPWKSGVKDDQVITFECEDRYKIQSDIQIPFTCDRYIAMNKKGSIRTKFGDGELTRISYDTKSCLLTIDLIHETTECQ